MARNDVFSTEVPGRGSGANHHRVLDGGTLVDDPAFVPRTAVFVRLHPEWDHIDPFRRYIESYAVPHFGDRIAARLALVVHELLENAVNYGSLGRDIEIDVRVAPVGTAFDVSVANQAVPSRVELLRTEIERMAALPPDVAYLDAIRRSKRRSQGSCGIGLARLRAEAEVELELSHQRGWITMRAKAR